MEFERAIAFRIGRFASILSGAVAARSRSDLAPVLDELEGLLGAACILERLVFTRNVLNTPGVPRPVIDRLLTDNSIVARLITRAGFSLDDESMIRMLAERDEAFQLDIATHEGISERITDYLIAIGDPEIAYRLARNKRAKLSAKTVVTLVEYARNDMRLLEALSNRGDLDAPVDDAALYRRAAVPAGLDARAPAKTKAARSIRKAPRRTKLISHK